MKTDSYAFVQMADEEGFRKITKDAVRLFGIQMQVSCVYKGGVVCKKLVLFVDLLSRRLPKCAPSWSPSLFFSF